ncbi:MAG TPA: succinate dehydrogenase/fumarate reductase iron-sulfur subunit [Candidatus Methanoperedens sp.]|nr:succinate dehydrogenase/fumarate reductase iron-sulfur subunit [Candidatus Methanoperedens sp.]HLB72052.1 succinate dehydrogenase/fumarate reductase iron-sulfur subunit [Candidatus Methanoperedens sp.]
MKFRIKRSDGEGSHFDVFDVKVKPYMSVLEALFQIQDEQDSSLSFRYSCRGAVCGSCAMLINKKQRLACRTQVSEIAGETVLSPGAFGAFARPLIKTGEDILVEPLPNLPVIKDLIVDWEPFFEHYRKIKPWLNDDEHSEKEKLMTQSDVRKVDSFAACILCCICYGACPVAARDKDFLGPAALAKAWRFYADTRNKNAEEILSRVDTVNGVWKCDEVYRCVEVCPKKVPPTNAITGFMRRIIMHRIKMIFR